MLKTPVSKTSRVYLVGGGISSMAAAAFLIRDGDLPGHRITIFEESDGIGGSLDGSGSPETGYVLRGGRMLESKYLCNRQPPAVYHGTHDFRVLLKAFLALPDARAAA